MTRAEVRLQFGDGSALTAFESFSHQDNYVDPLGSLDVTVRPPKSKRAEYREKLQRGNLVTLFIDGHPQCTPIIVDFNETIDADGVSMDIRAEGVLTTTMDASVDPDTSFNVTASTPVGEIVLQVLEPYGLDTIAGDSSAAVSAMTGKPLDGRKAAVDVDALKVEDFEAKNEPVYSYCRRLFSRLGLVMRVDASGVPLLGSPDFDQQAAYTLIQGRERDAAANRMLSPIRISSTNKGQFSHVIVQGRSADKRGKLATGAPIGGVKWADVEVPADAFGSKAKLVELARGLHSYKSEQGAAIKPLYYLDKQAKDVPRCEAWAQSLMSRNAVNAWQFQCAVDGFVSATDRVWSVDTVARVRCEDAELDEELWVMERTLTQDRRNGQRTRMKLIPKGALVLGGP